MKIKFILFGMLLGGAITQANAQFHVGIKAGANYGKITGVSFADKFKLGYHVGGFAGYDLNKIVGIQGEVLFNSTNFTVEHQNGSVIDDMVSGKKRLNYVNVPVMIKLLPKSIVSFFAGPQFSMLTNKDKTVLENGQYLLKSSDFSVVGGAELNLGPVGIYVRYIHGYRNISDNGEKAKNNLLQGGVSVKFM